MQLPKVCRFFCTTVHRARHARCTVVLRKGLPAPSKICASDNPLPRPPSMTRPLAYASREGENKKGAGRKGGSRA
eukprot:70400-Chlamydomonas_euryale.AAC.1